VFNILDLAWLQPVCRAPHSAGSCEASCYAEVQRQLQTEFTYICLEALDGEISGTSGRTKDIVIFRMLLLALLCDNNSASSVQYNFTRDFQFGIK